jgi:tripartite-type tricarboxylate transporter receptor subunit TctC
MILRGEIRVHASFETTAAGVFFALATAAQARPVKPVNLLNPFPRGGGMVGAAKFVKECGAQVEN